MARTKLERVEVGVPPGVAAFRVSGKLGFHENKKIQNLVDECLKRDFKRVVFDFSELSSLGGGVAKILREFVNVFKEKGGMVGFVITKDVILRFLQDDNTEIECYKSYEDALSGKGGTIAESEPAKAEEADDSAADELEVETFDSGDVPAEKVETKKEAEADQSGVILMSYDGEEQTGDDTGSREDESGDGAKSDNASDEKTDQPWEESGESAGDSPEAAAADVPPASDRSNEILSEIFEGKTSEQTFPEWIDKPTSPFSETLKVENTPEGTKELNKQLRRKVLELKTLFSISTDFNSIRERKKLIDIFLLTSIAQGGVESAAYFEKEGDSYKHAFSKGLNVEAIEKIEVSNGIDEELRDSNKVIALADSRMSKGEKTNLKSEGLEYICPFRQKNELTGLVFLGKRIAVGIQIGNAVPPPLAYQVALAVFDEIQKHRKRRKPRKRKSTYTHGRRRQHSSTD